MVGPPAARSPPNVKTMIGTWRERRVIDHLHGESDSRERTVETRPKERGREAERAAKSEVTRGAGTEEDDGLGHAPSLAVACGSPVSGERTRPGGSRQSHRPPLWRLACRRRRTERGGRLARRRECPSPLTKAETAPGARVRPPRRCDRAVRRRTSTRAPSARARDLAIEDARIGGYTSSATPVKANRITPALQGSVRLGPGRRAEARARNTSGSAAASKLPAKTAIQSFR